MKRMIFTIYLLSTSLLNYAKDYKIPMNVWSNSRVEFYDLMREYKGEYKHVGKEIVIVHFSKESIELENRISHLSSKPIKELSSEEKKSLKGSMLVYLLIAAIPLPILIIFVIGFTRKFIGV